VPNTIRPGDVLADRYRLVDLLNESGSGRFWRAHDRVLHRHVAVQVIESGGERATALLDAARASAAVLDRRLLRVLDADCIDGVCFVVNEWGSGSSLDVMLAKDGPLGARRAAWIVSEVADAIAVAHDRGVAHGRLVPENVLVDGAGSVRVIGCCVDAALHGVEARPERDVADLGALLYCALTGRWPGGSASRVAPAPTEHDRVLRPRQVRAGIPRPLDGLCDAVLHGSAGVSGRAAHDLTTALGISHYLRDFVGDTAGMAEAEVAAQPLRGQDTVVLPALRLPPPPEPLPAEPYLPSYRPDDSDGTDETPAVETADPAPPRPEQPTGQPSVPWTPAPTPSPRTPAHPEPPATPAPVEAPTEAGLPIFDDASDDVSWLTARSTPAPPPPPFEPPPERPLFAPEPDDGQPVRRPRPGTPASAPGAGYWPWETGTGAVHQTGTGTGVPVVPAVDEEVPGRSWLRLALVLGLGLVLLLASVVAYNLGRGRTPLGAEPASQSPSASASPSRTPAPAPIAGLVASDLDPQGDPPSENPELAPLAVDGDPATGWNTSTYTQNLGPAGLKTGVGLTVDLGSSREVSSVDVTVAGGATGVSVYVSDTDPSGVGGLRPAATATVSAHRRLTLDNPATGRYVVVWLTSLPFTDGGYRGEVDEVAVRG
jgi:hypothetical protein